MLLKLRRLLAEDDGPTAVEYAVMLAMIIMVCFAAIKSIGGPTQVPYSNVSSSLSSGS